MVLLVSLFLYLLLSRTSSCRVTQEVDQFNHHPVLHLPLYHVRGGSHSLQTSDTPLPFLEALALDEERVKYLNSRLDDKKSTAVHPVATSILEGSSSSWIDEKSVNLPLNPGIPIGISNYYTKIGLGTPTTYYNVIMDTGSSFSWIQCEPCLVYCHPQVGSPPFNPSASKTYQKLSCGTSQCSSLKVATLNSPMCTTSNTCIYSATYGDQSFSIGYLSKDSLSFGSQSLPGFVFGCGQDNNGLFGKSAGLIGLGKDDLSILSQLSTKYGRVFSYCLPTSSLLGNTGSGGFLSIGTTSNSAYKFTPMLNGDSSLYFIKLSAIYLSGKPLAVGSSVYSSPTIIDSGTTISRLYAPIYSALKKEFVNTVSIKYKIAPSFSILDACFYGTFDQISTAIPSVELIFQGGANLKLAPHNIILQVEKGTTCLAFASSSGRTIIGNTQQQTFNIIYDVASSKIGFAAGGCR